jgi:hypothetical protein
MKLSHFHCGWAAALLGSLAIVAVFASSARAHDEEGAETPPSAKAEDAAATEEEDSDDPNLGALSITIDSTFTTAYMFRGILNVRDGLIWQPSISLSLNLFESEEGVVESVDLGMGTWLSIQSEDYAGTPGSDGTYEVDYYPSLSVTWAGGITSAITYYFYTSPNDTFRTVEEVAIDLSYDDSEMLGAFALNPTATFAFETHSTSFGTGKGAVFELGLEPGVELELPCEKGAEYPIALTFPFKMGLSMDEYYNDNAGEDDTFGYARLGLHAGIPLACIPPRYGQWSITNGFDVYFLGDALETYNQNDEVYPVWTSSITMDY